MKVLLTGASGYIGKRLLPVLIEQGHHVVCCVRDKNRFEPPISLKSNISVIEIDFLKSDTLDRLPNDLDGAYYLIHSMSHNSDYSTLELKGASNFNKAVSKTGIKHVVYLSGIVNENDLSDHLSSRKAVEEKLGEGNFALTSVRAGIIIGSGSASFEIIRDLVEKLPIMIAPKWLNTRCQPIAIRDVIQILSQTLFNEKTYNQNYDIGANEVLSYKQMLEIFAEVRGLKRWIYTVPVMTPKLSSYWLYFITATSYRLASALVDSMKVEVVCRNNDLMLLLNVQPLPYHEALKKTFSRIQNQEVVSSWKDAHASSDFNRPLSELITVPEHGCLKDQRRATMKIVPQSIDRIWRIGGDQGWYYANLLWRLRGYLDKLFGGVGLRRGRTDAQRISAGDAIDFWRVLYANKEEGRLLLYAEMKLPGEAWLEFKTDDNVLFQTATFRPKGLPGRLYWHLLLPFHNIIFRGMIKRITS